MRTKPLCIVFVLLTAGPLRHRGWAQQPSPLTGKLSQIHPELRDDDWRKRREGFYGLIRLVSEEAAGGRTYLLKPALETLSEKDPGDADRIKVSMIELLERENRAVREYSGKERKLGEDYSDYYGDAIAAVSGLRDVKAVNALLGAVETGGMAERGLAELGQDALVPVLALLNNQQEEAERRAAAVRVLGHMLDTPYRDKVDDPVSRSKIEQGVLKAAADREFAVRLAAVNALRALGDEQAITALERLAREDPVRLPGKSDDGGDFYPVRLDARRALNQIRSKGH